MIKSIFVGLSLPLDKYKQLSQVGANHLIVAGHSINKNNWKMLEKTGCDLEISINAFDQGGCPLDPSARDKLERRVKNSLRWKPKEIWLDHFRFDGHWEAVDASNEDKVYVYKNAHEACRWCRGKDRGREIAKLARWVKSLIPENVSVGYFAVPFKLLAHTKLVSELGHDHRLLGNIFDMTSPMLYHRMIRKSVSYISEYTKYLHKLTQKPVLPIIQIKDMPDDLPDRLSWNEVKGAYQEAKKKPSMGVSVFMWEHAVEKDKVDLIKEIFLNS